MAFHYGNAEVHFGVHEINTQKSPDFSDLSAHLMQSK